MQGALRAGRVESNAPPSSPLQCGNGELESNARAALASACESLEARALVGTLLEKPEHWVQLLYQGPLPPTPPDFRYKVAIPL